MPTDDTIHSLPPTESVHSSRVDIIETFEIAGVLGTKRHDHEWRDLGTGYAECVCGAFGTLDWKWPR